MELSEADVAMSSDLTGTAVILAAGAGTRMRSDLPKALQPLGGQPMIQYLIDSCEQVFERIVVVVGPGSAMSGLSDFVKPHVTVVQHDRLGTAHAALQAEVLFGVNEVAVLYADNPLVSPATLRRLLERRACGDVGLALLAMTPSDPAAYGRVIEEDGYVARIVEWTDASEAERQVGLCNAGVVCAAAADMRQWLRAVGNGNTKGEYYLTDVVSIARDAGARVAAVRGPESELLGINSPEELSLAEASLRQADAPL